MKYVDLHIHTRYSDGEHNPTECVRKAAINNLETIAIADHDTTRGIDEAKSACDKLGLELINGVEISTEQFHILGYNFNKENESLQDLLSSIRENQDDKTMKRVEILQEYGVPIQYQDITNLFPEARIGKPNIVHAMLNDPECNNYLLDKFGQNNFRETYWHFMGRDGIARDTSNKYEISSKEAIDAIHNAGGIAVVAHPFKDTDAFSDIETLISEGIDGLEVQPGYGDKNDEFYQKALQKNMLITYGSDFHGEIIQSRYILERDENLIEPFWE